VGRVRPGEVPGAGGSWYGLGWFGDACMLLWLGVGRVLAEYRRQTLGCLTGFLTGMFI